MIKTSGLSILGRHVEIMTAVYDRINNVHKRPLHKAQIQIAKDYFVKGMKVVMSQWSRNGGKTEAALFNRLQLSIDISPAEAAPIAPCENLYK